MHGPKLKKKTSKFRFCNTIHSAFVSVAGNSSVSVTINPYPANVEYRVSS
jgi:hypothetical protein